MIQKEILLAAVRAAAEDKLTPEETVALVLRAMDHEMAGADGESFNPAQISGIGPAIYAAMFDYPLELLNVPGSGYVWRAKIPRHGFSDPFTRIIVHGQQQVAMCRKAKNTQQGLQSS